MKRRILSVFVALFFLIPLTLTTVNAVSPSYSATSYYRSSRYYQRLSDVVLTGDQRTDIVNVAISQLGYHEGDSLSDLDGMNNDGTGNFTEYNYFNGYIDNTYGYYWCASFVTWCARQAGIGSSVITTSVSCDSFVSWFSGRSQYHTRASGYIPIAGDLIFYKSSDSTRQYASHIGIVVGSDGSGVSVIEGNTSRGLVNYRYRKLSDTYIVGYAEPAYGGTKNTYNFGLYSGYVEPGEYKVVSSAPLNLRASASSSSSSQAQIANGTILTITQAEGDWGKTQYNGIWGWVSLAYVEPSNTSLYKVNYQMNGGASELQSEIKYRSVAYKVTSVVPERPGYEFLGWSEIQDAGDGDYKTGDLITENKNITLYAVWRFVGIKIDFLDYNGEVISRNIYEYGAEVVVPDNPVRETDGKYGYSFTGWDGEIQKTALEDETYTAEYASTPVTESTSVTNQVIDGTTTARADETTTDNDDEKGIVDSITSVFSGCEAGEAATNAILLSVIMLSTGAVAFIKKYR